jgi:hypothetical protein
MNIHKYIACIKSFMVTSMNTEEPRKFEVTYYHFNVMIICTSVNYALKKTVSFINL